MSERLQNAARARDESRLERRYARVHRLYVTELMVRATQPTTATLAAAATAETQTSTVEQVLKKMKEPDRTRWLRDLADVQHVYPRQVWADRGALVT